MATKKTTKTKTKQIQIPDSFCIIAADLSLDRPGFCLWTQISPTEIEIKTWHIDNHGLTTHGEKLDKIFSTLGRLRDFENEALDADIPVFWVREHAFLSPGRGQNQGGIFEVVGLTNWWLYCHNGKEWNEIFPVSVKKHITGKGKADKKEVEKCLEDYVGKRAYGTDDESDATAVAVTFLIMNNKLPHMHGGEDDDI